LILDQITGSHHSVAIRKQLLEPLQLTNTYYELNEPARGECAHGYEKVFGFKEDTWDWTPDTTGAAGLVSTVSDLAVFVRSVAGTNGFLSEKTRKILKSQVRPGNTDDPSYPVLGYDFGITFHRGAGKNAPLSVAPWFFGHDGATPGYFCMAFHEPRHDITVVYFGSSQLLGDLHGRRLSQFESRLEEALFGLAVEQSRKTSAEGAPTKQRSAR
jgi:D-alanyl-D-alanine carboxypeptidase